MAENVLRRCIEYEVIDDEYKITEKGFQVIEDGMIYRFYDGVFYLYVTKDPIIPQKILDQLGGLDSGGYANEPLKFVQYCLVNL